MPEVVEVRKYSDFIRKILHNNKINQINILQGRYKKHGPFIGFKKLVKHLPLQVIDVKTKGKFIYFIFNDDLILFNTLGLSGGWVYSSDREKYIHPDLVEFLNDIDVEKYRLQSLKHLNVEFVLEKGYLYFFDQLSYGTLSVDNKDGLQKKLNKLGPDMLDLNTSYDIFEKQIKKKLDKKIGLVLMDQKVVSGVGNYLRADSLWLARISPHRLVKNLDDGEIKRLYKCIKRLVWSDYDYRLGVKKGIIKDGVKRPIEYGRDFFVYYEEKDIYGNMVRKEELYSGSQKRFIYWCPKRQK